MLPVSQYIKKWLINIWKLTYLYLLFSRLYTWYFLVLAKKIQHVWTGLISPNWFQFMINEQYWKKIKGSSFLSLLIKKNCCKVLIIVFTDFCFIFRLFQICTFTTCHNTSKRLDGCRCVINFFPMFSSQGWKVQKNVCKTKI